MYTLVMTTALKKKPVTVYLHELNYLMFQKMAEEQNRKAAELVRDAMDEYIQNHAQAKKTLDEWKPLSLGGLRPDANDWLSKDFQEELLGGGF